MARETAYADDAVTTEADAITEPAAAPAEPTEAEVEAANAEHQATVDAFIVKADAAVEGADGDTGTVPEVLLDAASNAYREVTGGNKFKNLAKSHLQDQMKAALTSGPQGYSKAAAYNEVQEAVLTAAATKKTGERKPPRPAVSPDKVYADKVLALRTALELIEANRPEDVTDEWEDKLANPSTVSTEAFDLFEFTSSDQEGDEPEVSAIARAAVKIALGKSPTRVRNSAATGVTYDGPRRDVAAHILSAFAEAESGEFLTIAQIKAHKSDEYGDDSPSAGAINARLFPKSGKPCSVEGIEPGQNEKDVNGATKL